jgi:Carboxypeptidase regulatory-like domain
VTKLTRITAVVLLVAFNAAASAGSAGVLEGSVVDESGRPVANQPVYLQLPKGPTVAFSDYRGVFQFFNVPPGKYTVSLKSGAKVPVEFRDPTRAPLQTLPEPLVVRSR